MVYQLKVIFDSKDIEQFQQYNNFMQIINDINEEDGINTFNVDSVDIAGMDKEEIAELEEDYDPITGPKTIINPDGDFKIHEEIPSSEDDLMNMIEEDAVETDSYEDDDFDDADSYR